jgi:hypothetical protein
MAILFHIYFRTSPGVTKDNGTKIADVSSPYEHADLENGVPHYYVVTAFDTDTGLESEESAEAFGVPAAPVDAPVPGRRTPVSLVVLSMDFCGRVFGVDPCLATGTACFNTYPTCKYKGAYRNVGKEYRFSSADAPVPFD